MNVVKPIEKQCISRTIKTTFASSASIIVIGNVNRQNRCYVLLKISVAKKRYFEFTVAFKPQHVVAKIPGESPFTMAWRRESQEMELGRFRPKYRDHDGFLMPLGFPEEVFAPALKYEPDESDIFIATYPKCGTTWMQYILYLLKNKGEFIGCIFDNKIAGIS